MDIKRFNEIIGSLRKCSSREDAELLQGPPEWQAFLEFTEAYFGNRNISPIVVEIGVSNNLQKAFYEQFLNAEHIGIDKIAQPGYRSPDILGNSHDIKILTELKRRLSGRAIDLLFIDGDHSYAGVKSDYEMYGPLTKHIIAIHDIRNPQNPVKVPSFWEELLVTERTNTIITIQRDDPACSIFQVTSSRNYPGTGIGLILKQE